MKVIAHRGASGEFPENSLLAFEQAILQQADAIELDVHFHIESGQYIVIHDHHITDKNGDSRAIQDYSIDFLSNFSIGKQQTIPSLQQALFHIAGRVPVNIELKSSVGEQAAIDRELKTLHSLACQYIESFNIASDEIIISSFNHRLLANSKKLMPNYSHSALISHIPLDVSAVFSGLPHCNLNVDIHSINQELVQQAKSIGLSVNVYTVDEIDDIERCLALGVDAIFTNWPIKTRQYINNLTS